MSFQRSTFLNFLAFDELRTSGVVYTMLKGHHHAVLPPARFHFSAYMQFQLRHENANQAIEGNGVS